MTCTGFDKTKIGPYIPLSPKKYASIWLKFRMKAPGAPEEKLSALEAFVPPTHFVEWVGEPDYMGPRLAALRTSTRGAGDLVDLSDGSLPFHRRTNG